MTETSQPAVLPEENVTIADLRKQVADQARAIAHMAGQIATVYGKLAQVYASSNEADFLRMVGKDSAARMELLGNMMNNMDICTAEDAWTTPIFKKAHELWPQT